MTHHHESQQSDGNDQSDPGSGDTPDVEAFVGRVTEGSVDTGWLRPHTRRALGRPRVSTVVLMIVWIAVFVLYLELRPA
ncbi:hypothetical protein [Nocardia terpenica]|uniref:Uncharacterized protein n=1 Tax=Nocardia terpenica TaxID=455432 RepID=A0A6G9ZA02_9NOCA|nr:hypothetical protein [Nocardia terpenica]QIS22240.1 hypothetical protein F6W96_31755 [Nocardia terpenica]